MRVAVADNSWIFREALSRVFTDFGWQIALSASSGADLLQRLTDTPVDVAVVDVAMPPSRTAGISAALEIKTRYPHIAVLLMSAHAVTAEVIDLLREGHEGVGYLQKDEVADATELRQAIERVRAGEPVIDRSIVRRLLTASANERELSVLTAQEREVLRLMAEGHSNRGIAGRMHLSDRTVEDYVGRVFTKLRISHLTETSANKRVLAVLTWLRLTGATPD